MLSNGATGCYKVAMASIEEFEYYREHGEDLMDLAELCEDNVSVYRTASLIHSVDRTGLRLRPADEPPARAAAHYTRDQFERARAEINDAWRHTVGHLAAHYGTQRDKPPITTGASYSWARWWAATPQTGSGEVATITRAELAGAELYESATLYTVERHSGTPAAETLRLLYVAMAAGEAVVHALYQPAIRCSNEPAESRPGRTTIESYASFLRSLLPRR
jgi:hypothetical protein